MSLQSTLLYTLVGVVLYPACLWLLLKYDNHDFRTVAANKPLVAFYVGAAGMCVALWPVFIIMLFMMAMIWCVLSACGIRGSARWSP